MIALYLTVTHGAFKRSEDSADQSIQAPRNTSMSPLHGGRSHPEIVTLLSAGVPNVNAGAALEA